MPYLKSLGPDGDLRDLFKLFPQRVWPLLDYHDRLLRAPSPLSVAERELIAAFVSGLNTCRFCLGAHASIAEAFGVDPDWLEQLLTGDDSHAEPKLRPVLRYAKRLALEPSEVRQADVDAMLDAGWSEQTVYDVAAVVGLFSMMNRLVLGVGIDAPSPRHVRGPEARLSESYYRNVGRSLGIDESRGDHSQPGSVHSSVHSHRKR